ncbi:MAG: hypothetical protein HRU12_05895 [Phaeodactylibacter sp.]|nr:hypothetical protein [Phaeodactylibacter sp.]
MLKLPSSSSDSAEKPDIDPAFFHVTAKGEINQIEAGGGSKQVVGAGHTDYKHRKSTDPIMAGLDNQIQSYVGLAGDKAVVKVKADPEAKVQHVVDLFNILAKHGINKITLTKN